MTTVKLINIFDSGTSFRSITYEYIKEFEKFLTSRNYKINTIIKHIKHLRSFYNEAINQKLIKNDEDAFRRYKMLKVSRNIHSFCLKSFINWKLCHYVEKIEKCCIR